MRRKSKKGNIWSKLFFFLLGMLLMLGLDMVFHFNNSVEKEIGRGINKAKSKVENIFNK